MSTLFLVGLAPPATGIEKQTDVTAGKTECLWERPGRNASRVCIRLATYSRDLCHAIETLAKESHLPADYFARLIWRESLFRADAVSPKGAEGIAQFMPATAKLRGLKDSFDVAAALETSSQYLRDLDQRFGNLGLAAAAYNAGEARATAFLRNGRLPLETRDYVFAITGNPVEAWRDDPPKIAAERLNPLLPFHEACIALIETRNMREPVLLQSGDWAPWAVQLAANYNPSVTSRLMLRAVAQLPAPLNSERAVIVRQRRTKPGMRPKYQARIGRETRAEAIALCNSIHDAGVACAVVKN